MGIKNASRFFLITAAFTFALAGCGGEKKAEEAKEGDQAAVSADGTMPEGHPSVEGQPADDMSKVEHANIKSQKEVSLTEEVKATWKEAKLEVTDSSSGSKDVMAIQVGSTVPLKKEGFKLKLEALVPDYAISDNKIESRSNEARNPAVLVELFEGDNSVAKGWIFRDFPEFNSYKDERFPLSLVAPALDNKPVAAKK